MSNLFLLEQVAHNHQVYIVNRRDGKNVTLISESDLTSFVETVYLLSSPANGSVSQMRSQILII